MKRKLFTLTYARTANCGRLILNRRRRIFMEAISLLTALLSFIFGTGFGVLAEETGSKLVRNTAVALLILFVAATIYYVFLTGTPAHPLPLRHRSWQEWSFFTPPKNCIFTVQILSNYCKLYSCKQYSSLSSSS